MKRLVDILKAGRKEEARSTTLSGLSYFTHHKMLK